jgi:SET domain-containing protein
MLLIDTFVGPSAIEGVGVFAGEPIGAGQLVWRFNPVIDRVVTPAQMSRLPEPQQAFLQRYAYFDAQMGGYLLDGDNARFLNHSVDPNIEFRADANGYALRDIEANEELSCDYGLFMPEVVILPSRLTGLPNMDGRNSADLI